MIVYLAVGIGGLALLGLHASSRRAEAGRAVPRSTLSLKADHNVRWLGDVRIDQPAVEVGFAVTNSGPTAVTLADVYTTCACVTATVRFPDGATEGPFGVKGHGRVPSLRGEVAPGETFTVSVRLDPALAGPDGSGRAEYHVRIHTANGGAMATLTLAANLPTPPGSGSVQPPEP